MDPWTAFLDFLQTILVPNWGELITMLPFFLLLGAVGPVLTLLLLYHLYHFVKRRSGRVRIEEPVPVAALLDATSGEYVFPANVPFCARHGLIYPPHETSCEIDKEELSVRCPVDDIVRTARQQTCRACGTRYELGASRTALTIRRTGRPPEGGAAVA